ncbi:PAP2-domain-containing protein [Auriculariales sp. MPI-PUGE-AT-0066]|nr:PAP2-domain-containing protein [Auriculariales sp. MPI-PUGE-AT-0066]
MSTNPRNTRSSNWASSERRRYTTGFLIKSYAPDWIVSIFLWGLFTYLGTVSGFRRDFSLTDTSIQHRFALHERVPEYAGFIISTVTPLVVIPVVSLLTPARGIADIHSGCLGAIVSLAITGCITGFCKVLVGRPRPDLIDRCQPALGSANAPIYGLATYAICTTTDSHIMNDGWRSFPSAHSSLCFAGLTFLSLYLGGKLHLWDQVGSGIKAWVTVTPMCAAAVVAITRTMDNRHHATDVIAGSLLGIGVAYFTYRQYYPPLNSPTSHIPYPPLRRLSDALPLHGDDDGPGGQARNSERAYRDDEEHTMGLAHELETRPRRSESIDLRHPEGAASSPAGKIVDSSPRSQ